MLVFVKALSLLLLSFSSKAEGVHFGCDSFGSEVELNFQGEVQLHQGFLSNETSSELAIPEIKEAIKHQMRYARGYFINARKSLPYSLTVDAENPAIDITDIQDVPYGKALSIDTVIHPGVKVETPYILKALTAKKVQPSDSSKLIKYKAKANAYYCGPKESLETVEAAIPKDPYLMYWSVAKTDRRKIGWRHAKFTMNPCADSEFADIPDPYYYWYFWNPFQSGQDLQQKSFHCQELLKKNDFYTMLKPKVMVSAAPQTATTAELPSKKNELSATVIFGVIDEQDKIYPWQEFLKSIEKKKSLSFSDFQRELRAMKPAGAAKNLDRGSQYLNNFVNDLQNVAEISALQASSKDSKVILRGKLIESQKPIELVLWFGYTDVLGLKSPQHWEVLKQALASSQYILYNGHSGLGNNMKIDNVLEATQAKAEEIFKTAPPQQMLAYFSCYSYGYFGDDAVAYRQKFNPNSQTDILLTGSEFTSERGPLGLLKHLDFFAAKQPSTLDRSAWLFGKDQLIVKSFKGSPESKGSL